jgi:hypothetical protein
MKDFPKKRYAYGLDWRNWNVGFQMVKVADYGLVTRITVFSFVFYLTMKKFN